MTCNPVIVQNCLPNGKLPKKFDSLKEITEHYISCFQPGVRKELEWLKKLNGVDLIKHTSYMTVPDWKDFSDNSYEKYKRDSHHYRKKDEVLKIVKVKMEDIYFKLMKLPNFDEILNKISGEILSIKGIGPLYIYDIAFKLCVNREIYPDKIYLHSGTRIGARNLGLEYKADFIEKNILPKEFEQFKPYEIENVLCVYKDKFSKEMIKLLKD